MSSSGKTLQSAPESVSVVIPTYNRARLVVEAVESVLKQSYPPLEVLVVDDGSTDVTEQALAPYRDRLCYLRTPHQGVSRARNAGWRMARGTWVGFLDSDDLWLPRKLERQIQALRSSPETPLCYTDEIWIRNQRRVNQCRHHAKYSGWILPQCLPRCIISPSSALIRRDVLEELGGFEEALEVCEDYELWLRLTARFPVLFLEEKLIVKRGGHPDQLSKRFWGMDRFRIWALARLLQDPNLRDQDRKAALSELRRKCAIYAQGARKRGRHEEAEWYERVAELSRWEEVGGGAVFAGCPGGGAYPGR